MSHFQSIDLDRLPRITDPAGAFCAIYLIREGKDGACKVGIADHLLRRLSKLQTGNPRPLNICKALGGTRLQCRNLEKAIAIDFKSHRLIGEWYSSKSFNRLSDFFSRAL